MCLIYPKTYCTGHWNPLASSISKMECAISEAVKISKLGLLRSSITFLSNIFINLKQRLRLKYVYNTDQWFWGLIHKFRIG
jgi:hypothetical protein